MGFIGLGNMGKGMAKNLLDKGHEVVAFDANVSVLEDAASLGAKKGTSPKVRDYQTVDRYVVKSCAPIRPYNFLDPFSRK